MNKVQLILVTLTLCASATVASSLTVKEVAERSSLWPFYISVVEEIPSIPAAARKFPGVLLRIEDDQALIDFGRDGVHRVDLAATDILEASARLQSGEVDPDLANFTRYTTNIFFAKNVNDVFAPIPVDKFADTERYLMIYAPARIVEDEPLFEAIDTLLAASDATGNASVVLGLGPGFYKAAASKRIDWTMVQPHSSIAYREALRHEPEVDLTIVLIDAYGKVLYRKVLTYATLLDRARMDALCEQIVHLSEATAVRLPQFRPFDDTVPASFGESLFGE